jgi:hypothetical protein
MQPIDYTNRDYASLRQALIDTIPDLLPEWTTRTDDDFGMVLIDLFSYVGDIMNYYVDRVFNEMFLPTAVRRQSVLNIAALLDYVPISMAPAETTLTFTLQSGSSAVTIPKGTAVSTLPEDGSSPIVFETDADLVISGNAAATPQYSGSIAATQGQTISEEVLTLSATGDVDQEYTLFQTSVVEGSVEIEVDEGAGPVMWMRQRNLIDCSGPDRCFSITIDENSVLHVHFGDNVNGRIPSTGSLIKATYRVGDGARGNVGANQVTELLDVIIEVDTVTNPQGANGGADEESIESMRTAIPKSLQALERAVTLDDYAALAVRVPGVGKAQADATVYTTVSLYVAPVGGGSPAQSLKDDVQQYLIDRKLINVLVSIFDPSYQGVNVTATVNVLANHHQVTVKQAVENAIRDLLSFDQVDFQQPITVSSVYHAIQGVDGVDYANVSLLVRADAATQAGVQDVTFLVGEIPTAGTITLNMNGGIS